MLRTGFVFEVVEFMALPIRRLRHLANPLTREFTTSIVTLSLIPTAQPSGAR